MAGAGAQSSKEGSLSSPLALHWALLPLSSSTGLFCVFRVKDTLSLLNWGSLRDKSQVCDPRLNKIIGQRN